MPTHTVTQIPSSNVAFVPAAFELLPMLTVAENVVLPLRLAASPADPAWLDAVLRVVELEGQGDTRPIDLSRGEQLRVALARALVTRPGMIVVDDLDGTVDSVTRHGVIRTLRRVAVELEISVVLATRDAADAALADRIRGDAV
jgi:putative ABC transport system ATP-binding protein